MGSPCASAGKESTCNVGDLGSIPGLGRSPRGGKGNPLQYSGLENPVDFHTQVYIITMSILLEAYWKKRHSCGYSS